MKTQFFSFVLALLLAASSALKAQDRPNEYIGLPGDNLNLYAVMHLFQNSETLEGFERSLNDPETIINNLDLNGDNLVDYIMVYNYADGNIHTIVLRVALNEREQQDVAVFTVEKLRDGAVQMQLIGDQALYGANYIIEPMYDETPNPGYGSTVTKQKVKTRRNVTVVQTTYYEVASWPVIVYIYQPTYRVWRSAYRWGYYPVYWHPWTPHYYHYYYGYHYNSYDYYYAHYRPWRQPRSVHYHNVYYTSIRNYSPTIAVNVNKGTYKNTYSHPEKRSEGERVYAQRQSTGSNLPGRSSVGGADGRQGSRPAQDVNQRGTKSANDGRTTEVRDIRTGNVSRQNTETNRSRNETATPARNNRGEEAQKTTAPSRNDASPNVREVNRSSREQAAPARSVEPTRTSRPASPAQKKESSINSSKERSSSSGRVERPASEPKKEAVRSTPSAPKRESRTSVESSKPAKTESRTESRVKTPDRNSSSRSSGNVESKSSGSRQSSKETKSNSPGRR